MHYTHTHSTFGCRSYSSDAIAIFTTASSAKATRIPHAKSTRLPKHNPPLNLADWHPATLHSHYPFSLSCFLRSYVLTEAALQVWHTRYTQATLQVCHTTHSHASYALTLSRSHVLAFSLSRTR
jgi:hypothetical protein